MAAVFGLDGVDELAAVDVVAVAVGDVVAHVQRGGARPQASRGHLVIGEDARVSGTEDAQADVRMLVQPAGGLVRMAGHAEPDLGRRRARLFPHVPVVERDVPAPVGN